MTTTAMRLEYRVLADNAENAVGRAKETCRAEGYVLRGVVSVKPAPSDTPEPRLTHFDGQWLVTLVVKAPA
jgi:hypothetical protein